MSLTRTLAATLAICALGAPVASASQPADQHASVAIAAAKERAKQDLRSPDARDAAIHLHRSGLVVGVTQPVAAKPAPAPAPAVKSDDGIDWATVALGIAGSMIAVVGIALVTSRRRMPPLRPSA
jgi:mannose/fructose/N-acetylgalactosamine-specific phosphotransferase system component IIC